MLLALGGSGTRPSDGTGASILSLLFWNVQRKCCACCRGDIDREEERMFSQVSPPSAQCGEWRHAFLVGRRVWLPSDVNLYCAILQSYSQSCQSVPLPTPSLPIGVRFSPKTEDSCKHISIASIIAHRLVSKRVALAPLQPGHPSFSHHSSTLRYFLTLSHYVTSLAN